MWTDGTNFFESHADIRYRAPQSLPAVITDEVLAGVGFAPVIVEPQPVFEVQRQVCERHKRPTLVNGAWHLGWTVRAMTSDEQALFQAKLQKTIVDSVQARLDGFAQTRGYDSILSLATYATSAVSQFAAEGARGVALRDATWAKASVILDEVSSGTRPLPSSYADIEPELPPLTWPD